MNLYGYVGNDPLNATDPSGERIIIELREYKIGPGYSHAYIVIIDGETGEVYFVRAGPSGGVDNVGSFSTGSDAEDKKGKKVTLKAVSGNSAKRAECSSGNTQSNCKGKKDNNRVRRTLILDEGTTMKEAKAKAKAFVRETNKSKQPYAVHTNSNTFATTLFDEFSYAIEQSGEDLGLPGTHKKAKDNFNEEREKEIEGCDDDLFDDC